MVVPMQKAHMCPTKTLHSTTPKAVSPIVVTWKSKNKEQKQKTYNSGYSPVVTHLTTNPPVHCLSTAERTSYGRMWRSKREKKNINIVD
jgi:hypothetical protein